MFRPAVLLVIVLVAIPGAAADLRIIEAKHPGALLQPESEAREVNILLEIDCNSAALRLQGQNPEVPVVVQASSPDTVILDGPSNQTLRFDARECASPDVATTLATDFILRISKLAIGLEPLTVRIDAALRPDPLGMDQSADNVTFAVAAAPVVVLEARAARNLARIDGPVSLPINVANFGNVPTHVDAQANASVGRAEVGPVDLEQPGRDGAATTLMLHYTPPAGRWQEATVDVLLSPSEPSTGQDGEPVQIQILVANDAFLDRFGPGSVGIDAAVAAVAVVAVVGVLLVWRRRAERR